MPKDKKIVTRGMANKATRLFERALHLQGEMYSFAEVLKEIGREDLAEQLISGAFEMDLTWNNADKVAKEVSRMYEK